VPEKAADGPLAASAGATQYLTFPAGEQYCLDLLESEEGVPEAWAILSAVMHREGTYPSACYVSISNVV
jgi:hypothetical protein